MHGFFSVVKTLCCLSTYPAESQEWGELIKVIEAISMHWEEHFKELLDSELLLAMTILDSIQQKTIHLILSSTTDPHNDQRTHASWRIARLAVEGLKLGTEGLHSQLQYLITYALKETVPGRLRHAKVVTTFKRVDCFVCRWEESHYCLPQGKPSLTSTSTSFSSQKGYAEHGIRPYYKASHMHVRVQHIY